MADLLVFLSIAAWVGALMMAGTNHLEVALLCVLVAIYLMIAARMAQASRQHRRMIEVLSAVKPPVPSVKDLRDL